jgi:hypothetical protein
MYDSLVVIYDELTTFDMGEFLFSWNDTTVKIFDFRESIVDKIIDAFFTLTKDPEVQKYSREILPRK